MNNTNKKSFAARAKALISKYKRAKFDPTEKQELEAALAQLAQEQEAYKAANGLGGMRNNEYTQPEGQSMPQYAEGGGFVPTYLQQPSFGITGIQSPDALKIGQDLTTNINNSITSNPMQGVAPEYTLGSTQGMLPSLIGAAGSLVGNYIMKKGVKPTLMNKVYSPEQVSLAKERAIINRQADEAKNVAMQSLRTAGNRGAYIGGVGTALTGLNKGLSDATTASTQKEALINLEQRNRAQAMNAEVDKYNAMQEYQANQDRAAYSSAMINSIPTAITDINQIATQNKMMELLGSKDYAILPAVEKERIRNALFGRQLKYKVKK